MRRQSQLFCVILVASYLCVNAALVLQDGSTQWASADLGSDERKQKFLRLMGAGKVGLVML